MLRGQVRLCRAATARQTRVGLVLRMVLTKLLRMVLTTLLRIVLTTLLASCSGPRSLQSGHGRGRYSATLRQAHDSGRALRALVGARPRLWGGKAVRLTCR